MRTATAPPAPTAARLKAGGIAAVAGGVVLWAGSSILVKTSEISGVTFAVLRLWVGFVALALVGSLAGRRLSVRVVRSSLLVGVLFAANIALFFEALRRTSIANVTLISALQPAFVFLVAGRMFGERVTRWDVWWTVASLGGIGLVMTGSAGAPGWHPSGDALAFVSILIWTVYFLASKRIRENTGTIEYFTAVLGVAAVALTPVMLATGGRPGDAGARDWALIAIVALGPGTLGHLLVTWAHRHVEASVSSMIVVGQPVVAATAAAAFLGERLTALQIAGGLVTIAAVAGVIGRRRVPEPDIAPEGAP